MLHANCCTAVAVAVAVRVALVASAGQATRTPAGSPTREACSCASWPAMREARGSHHHRVIVIVIMIVIMAMIACIMASIIMMTTICPGCGRGVGAQRSRSACIS